LIVRNSPLTKIPSALCELTKITELHLESNCIKSLPDNCINKLGTLNRLSLQGNQINKLQKGLFDGMQNLANTTVLDLSHNKIDRLDLQTLMSLDRIEELYLHSNSLSTLPMKFLQNSSTNLHVISLHDNPWDCSCENKWLKSWM
ncbi:hypothetical protein HELRODRAFT_144438, partial [Helobdella robusta]|uniref:LRRCT domain-containing protein n=1 Tax=Helobdella robusta TaxID=6412 RepID=T1EJE7_HELRO